MLHMVIYCGAPLPNKDSGVAISRKCLNPLEFPLVVRDEFFLAEKVLPGEIPTEQDKPVNTAHPKESKIVFRPL